MTAPIFVISDMHIGSGGARDSFEQYDRSSSFCNFLNYVEKEAGEIIILGDFIDLWRFSLKKVIKARMDLLDRLSEMKISCIPGNHDQALMRYMNLDNLPHPFFNKITQPLVKYIGGRKFSFFHGHELDIFNRNLTPRIGRFLGLSSSWIEYIKGYPVFSSENIEDALLNIEEKMFVSCLNVIKQLARILSLPEIFEDIQVLPRQKRIEKMILKHEYKNEIEGNDVAISAHTHRPLKFQNWHFNSGSWTDKTNDFIRILPDGKVSLFHWDKDTPKSNNNEIKSSFKYRPSAFTYELFY